MTASLMPGQKPGAPRNGLGAVVPPGPGSIIIDPAVVQGAGAQTEELARLAAVGRRQRRRRLVAGAALAAVFLVAVIAAAVLIATGGEEDGGGGTDSNSDSAGRASICSGVDCGTSTPALPEFPTPSTTMIYICY
eukprot:SAG25_NODE_528_length_7179_cov_40.901836_6_plen_135_part_00